DHARRVVGVDHRVDVFEIEFGGCHSKKTFLTTKSRRHEAVLVCRKALRDFVASWFKFFLQALRYPRSSRYRRIVCAASRAFVFSVSMRISAFSGASYGSSIPVNPLICPARAFLY